MVEIREPSLAAPVTAAVVGVVPGAALPALPGGFRDAPEASAGPGGSVPALDSDVRRLGGAPLRESGRDRLFGGRRVNSDVGARRESEPDAKRDVTLFENVRTAAAMLGDYWERVQGVIFGVATFRTKNLGLRPFEQKIWGCAN